MAFRCTACGCLLAALALLPAGLDAATEIHVAPSGNDANPGTAAQPVATPQGAQARVRERIAAGLSNAVEVVFAAGTYPMTAPLELRPADSGTAAFPITWKAATNGAVVLSGGKQITAPWTNGGNGIWFTDLLGVGLGTNQWNFRQLFVNGIRATRARYPNVTQANPFLYATGGSTNYAIVSSALVKSSWGTAVDAQINIVPQSRFFNQWNTVTGVNTNTGRIDIADSERHRLIDSGSWFWIEGVEAELDEPGEWFLNPTTGRLYYMPTNGVDPNTLEFVAPALNRIINVQGDVNAGTHVEYVHFDGLEFRYTDFTLGHLEPRVHTDTAIMFENTSDCSVMNCRFENIGGYALWLHLDSQRNVFDRNTVSYSGGGGVLLTGARFAYMDDTKVYTPGEAASKVAPVLNEITRNTVEHCGRIRYYGGGVHLDSRPFSMTMDAGNYIAHNHFNDLSRNGIFAFRNQGGNVIEYNHIHNAMQTTIDGACIHFATMNHLNAPNFILNNWLYDIWGYEQKPNGIPVRRLANGVFLDWDTSTTTVRDNWIYNSGAEAVKVIFGGNWNVVTSGNQSSSTPITPPFVAEVGPDGVATHGIDLAGNKLTGSVIHYTDGDHFSTQGAWTQESATGLAGLFVFNYLVGTAAVPSQAVYTLPISEDGTYQISLLYKPGADRASNAPIAIAHAEGAADVTWNMQQGSAYGFAVEVGRYRFRAAQTNTVTLSTTGASGKVIADSVAFVKIENTPPTATGVWISGTPAAGAELTGLYAYGDVDGDPEGASIFRWYRSDDAVLSAGDAMISGAASRTYLVPPGDSGKHLFFQVTPVAATGAPTGSAAASAGVLIYDESPTGPITLVEQSFSGTGAVLNGTSANAFAGAITSAGGSASWVAATNFLGNGAVVADPAAGKSAYLSLGSFIDNAKGAAAGYFELTLTISPIAGQWISLGFAAENTPNINKNFTGTSGSPATTGLGTIIYRGTAATSPNTIGELDMFGGNGNANAVDGPDSNTGNRTVTVTLDLTPSGGYNGTNNFGKVIWADRVLGVLGSFTYTTAKTFGSILISEASGSTGTISALTLVQHLPRPFEVAIAPRGPNLDFSWPSRAGRVYDLVSGTDLATPVSSWPVWDGRANIPAGGSTTTLTNVPPGDAARFFAVIEKANP